MRCFWFCFDLFCTIVILVGVVVVIITYIYLYKQYKLVCLKYDIDCKYKDGLIAEEDYFVIQQLGDKYDAHYSKENYLELRQKMTEILNRSSNNPQA